MDTEVLKYMSDIKDYYLGKTRLTTKEVVDILLEKDKIINNEKSINLNNTYEFNGFDMQELLKWRNKNNDKYEVKSHGAITSHRKIIGTLLVNGKKIVRKLLKWYIDPIVEQQNEFNGSVTASINALYNNECVTEQVFKNVLNDRKLIIELEEKNEQLILENKAVNDKCENLVNEYNEKIEELNIKIDEYNEKFKELNIKIDESNRSTDKINYRLEEINQESEYMKFKLYSLEKCKSNNREVLKKEDKYINAIINNKNEDNSDKELQFNQYGIDYFEFENRFRGARSNIKNKQKIYLEYFKDKNKVIDIGCGRGEFLELLEENNIKAEGVDICKTFVEYCEYKKLKVELGDAVSYISKMDDNSIDGIFMGQVAEHLEIEYLIELVTKAYNKLEKGSYFIAETPNPTMLSTFANAFYLDPSHKNPVHPETFKFILENVGFKDINIVFTKESEVGYKLPLLNGENISNLEEFNDGINLLSNLLFGSQDYAIIARK